MFRVRERSAVPALDDAIPDLRREPMAHSEEHSSEVLLPFLHSIRPDVRVVPITIGRANLTETRQLAEGLGKARDDLDEPPLVIISSDMNHFADDELAYPDGASSG